MTEQPKKKSKLGLVLWLGVMLTAISVALCFVPLVPCPACQTGRGFKGYTISCTFCRGSGRLSLRQKWFSENVIDPLKNAVK